VSSRSINASIVRSPLAQREMVVASGLRKHCRGFLDVPESDFNCSRLWASSETVFREYTASSVDRIGRLLLVTDTLQVELQVEADRRHVALRFILLLWRHEIDWRKHSFPQVPYQKRATTAFRSIATQLGRTETEIKDLYMRGNVYTHLVRARGPAVLVKLPYSSNGL